MGPPEPSDHPGQREPQLSGLGLAFHAADREKLVAYIGARYEAFRQDHSAAPWADFFRAEPLVIRRYAEKVAREYRPPALYTPEGHPILFGRLRYAVRDQERLMRGLLAAPDFDETTAPEDPAGTRQFAWIRIGPAERYVQEAARPDHGMMVSGQRFDDPRRPGVTSMATLTVAGQEMSAEALSAQRLAWLKARLAEAVGDAIHLRADVVEDPWRKLDAERGSRPPARSAPAVPPEVEAHMLGKVLHHHFTEWLDQPVPALDGRTPRTAARDARLRPKLIQLLREIENHQDHARRGGPRLVRHRLDVGRTSDQSHRSVSAGPPVRARGRPRSVAGPAPHPARHGGEGRRGRLRPHPGAPGDAAPPRLLAPLAQGRRPPLSSPAHCATGWTTCEAHMMKSHGKTPQHRLSYSGLVESIARLHGRTQAGAAAAVNHFPALRNWLIGARIVEFEQRGSDRARYGERLLEQLSADVVRRRVRGLSRHEPTAESSSSTASTPRFVRHFLANGSDCNRTFIRRRLMDLSGRAKRSASPQQSPTLLFLNSGDTVAEIKVPASNASFARAFALPVLVAFHRADPCRGILEAGRFRE
jgi:hypothetical protein